MAGSIILDDVREFAIDDFWDTLDAVRVEQGLSWTEFSERSPYERTTLQKQRGRMPRTLRLGDAAKLFKTLGYTLTLTAAKG